LFIVVALWLIVNTLLTNPRSAGAGLIMIGAGLPLYYYFRRQS
jgi:preprotein translocase subunit SecG